MSLELKVGQLLDFLTQLLESSQVDRQTRMVLNVDGTEYPLSTTLVKRPLHPHLTVGELLDFLTQQLETSKVNRQTGVVLNVAGKDHLLSMTFASGFSARNKKR
jgi:hypothetical protein